jgi:hypothetical protein
MKKVFQDVVDSELSVALAAQVFVICIIVAWVGRRFIAWIEKESIAELRRLD